MRFGLIAFSATIIISSCTDNQLNESTGLPYNPKFETYYKLVTFYEKMEGLPQTYDVITPRTDYSATDVRDYVEGTMNLVYTDPNLTWASYQQTIDTFTLTLSLGLATEQAVHLRMSTFGLFKSEGGSPNYYYWTGFNRFGTRTDCDEGGSFPYALPQCC